MNQISPLVTIYVTNHNYGRYLRQSLNSLFEQTFQDFEIILIDDGSTDDSRTIIEANYANSNINIIYQKNQGLNVTNNIALRIARGKYIMRLDADDYMDPNALLVMTNMLESDDELGLVFPDYFIVDKVGNILGMERRHTFDKDVSLFDQPAHGACTLIRCQFLLNVGGYNEAFRCQDGYDLWLKFITKYKVANVNLPLFYYRRHGANLTENEERLLTARSEMKAQFFDQHFDPLRTIAILPVRGFVANPRSFDLEMLGDRALVDWLIEAALQATRVDLLVLTTPDEQILTHVKQRYGESSRLLCLSRPVEQARLNVDLVETIDAILAHPSVQKISPDILLRLATEYPFITAANMDDAVNTLGIFGADSLISVRMETSLFFQHNGGGLVPILNQEKFTRLEREALYRHIGGLTLTHIPAFNEKRAFVTGKIGHILLSQKEAVSVRSAFDLRIARFLASDGLRQAG